MSFSQTSSRRAPPQTPRWRSARRTWRRSWTSHGARARCGRGRGRRGAGRGPRAAVLLRAGWPAGGGSAFGYQKSAGLGCTADTYAWPAGGHARARSATHPRPRRPRRPRVRLRMRPQAEVAGAAADAAREVGAMAGRVAELQRQCASSGEFLERRDALEAELGALRDKLGRCGGHQGWRGGVTAGPVLQEWRGATAEGLPRVVVSGCPLRLVAALDSPSP